MTENRPDNPTMRNTIAFGILVLCIGVVIFRLTQQPRVEEAAAPPPPNNQVIPGARPPRPVAPTTGEIDPKQWLETAPYMKRLQQHIKANWHPPKEAKSRRVVVVFKVKDTGKLLSVKTTKSSGVKAVDQSGLNAVLKSDPFEPLPKSIGTSADIEFTFDYNVWSKDKKI